MVNGYGVHVLVRILHCHKFSYAASEYHLRNKSGELILVEVGSFLLQRMYGRNKALNI